ncbi:YTH domain-containing protein, partial [Sphaerosporella brunnea]
RFFIIKSDNETNVYSALKWGVWTSSEKGNLRLDAAIRSNYGLGQVLLFFSVTGTGKFCAVAEMASTVDQEAQLSIWVGGRRGCRRFDVKWVFVKDVPMSRLRHIIVANNEGRDVTHSRDTQELYPQAGFQMLEAFNSFRSSTGMLHSGQM